MRAELIDVINLDWRRRCPSQDIDFTDSRQYRYSQGYRDALRRLVDIADAEGDRAAIERIRGWLG
jgi:hypothetical protein